MVFRLYGNENFPQPAVEHLRDKGYDVLTVLDSGHAGQAWPDEEVLRFAVSQRRALVTMNRRHFIRLHALYPDHQGIIVCTYEPDFVELALRIHRELASMNSLAGRLVRINRPQASES
uniref:DUF5615 domain-containing protein n=1 Tax=Candidatus Kentrum sp. FM TaxID=2126340 RepID=A0A450U1I8_9GAMM|nr:MAG: hypothetical protein BECKFM1743C_GA0114222_108883 [Candidatus Kentron sp. FM]VFJ76152.1 MAG: hypothetical protein BECKFM1743A_GA0114220_109091 [Candidatus Kentron sp. FM]VFK23323.1 MAG: hypothetical protein BECKFM1743B_GA0114221_109183 [Candidatus Kentron sp. FM]